MAIEMTIYELGTVPDVGSELSRLLTAYDKMLEGCKGDDPTASQYGAWCAAMPIDLTKLMSEISDLRVAVIEREREAKE